MNKKAEQMKLGTILLIGVAIFLAYQAVNKLQTGGTTIINPPAGGGGTPSIGTCPTSIPEDVTLTFASNDFMNQGTDAGTSNLIIKLGDGTSLTNVQVADDGTKTASTCDKIIAVIGNVTTGITSSNGNSYYPAWFEATVPATGKTFAVAANQPKSGTLNYAWLDEYGRPNTAQAVGSAATKNINIKLTAPSGACYGNPLTGSKNVMCMLHNTSAWESITEKSPDCEPTTKPQAINLNTTVGTGKDGAACVTFPVLCDNDPVQPANSMYEINIPFTIKAKSGINPADSTGNGAGDGFNVTFSDVSFDYNAKTLAKIVGVADENLNDIGIADIQMSDGYAVVIT